ncbi:MAG: hypothetical protein LQ346_005772, partial [Caloplaca aetnensis]
MFPDIFDLHLVALGSPAAEHDHSDSSPGSSTPSSNDASSYPPTTMSQDASAKDTADAHGHGQASQEPEQASAVAGVDGQAAQGVLVGVALTFAGYVSEGLFTLAWIPR